MDIKQNLKASLQLQKHLRQLTHRVLVAQEDERLKLSHELRDEIAQTLLGINVRLLLLKQAARSKAKGQHLMEKLDIHDHRRTNP